MTRLEGALTFERAKAKERLQTIHESPDAKTSYNETGKSWSVQIPGRGRAVGKVVEKNELRGPGKGHSAKA